MKCLNALVVGVLLLVCSVVSGHDTRGFKHDRSHFDWRNFFNIKSQQPSTPKPPPFADHNVNYNQKDNLFDVDQFADKIMGPDKASMTAQRLIELCPKDSFCKTERKECLATFCTGLREGNYYDPWNPFCGFIRCTVCTGNDCVSSDAKSGRIGGERRMKANRVVCKEGTWISDQYQSVRQGRDAICRVQLPFAVEDGNRPDCGSTYSKDMCKRAKSVLQMNDKTEVF